MKELKKRLTLAAAAVLIMTQGTVGLTKVSAKAASMDAGSSDYGKEEMVHVELPAFPEENGSVFDFIMDPQGLIEATDAAKYDGASFEKGRTLYFKNEEGAYAYSGSSDRLTVTNKSAVPVEVTVTAKLDHCEEIDLSADEKFSDGKGEIFLAVTDDRGSVTPLKGSEEVSVSGRLAAASGEGVAVYSFGLTGACNPDGDWENVSVRPVVTVTWKVTPLIPEEKESVAEEVTSAPEVTGAAENGEMADQTPTTTEPETTGDGTEPTAPADETKADRNPDVSGSQDETGAEAKPDQSVSSNNKLEQK